MDPTLDLADAQALMCIWINTYQTGLANQFFTWNNAQWDCDPSSQSNIIGACLLASVNGGNLPPGFQWRDANNNMVSLTGAQMITMGSEMFTFISACYQAAWAHKTNVNALTTTADVAAYNYVDTLWPNPMVQV